MKLYHHLLIIAILILLLYFLYDKGLGIVPFLLAALYFGYIGIKEFQRFKKSKRW